MRDWRGRQKMLLFLSSQPACLKAAFTLSVKSRKKLSRFLLIWDSRLPRDRMLKRISIILQRLISPSRTLRVRCMTHSILKKMKMARDCSFGRIHRLFKLGPWKQVIRHSDLLHPAGPIAVTAIKPIRLCFIRSRGWLLTKTPIWEI